MAQFTRIEWTEQTWNPTTGCSKFSPGCQHCYAEVMARRLKAMGVKGYENGFKLALHPERLMAPLMCKKPSLYFVNSMSDLFHEDVPTEYIQQVFDVMKKAHWHTFQVLTKRAERMAKFCSKYELPRNAWLGVTVENKKDGLPRVNHLRRMCAQVLFLSVEPLLEDLGEVDLTNINWVIVGGESGVGARPMKKEWVANIKRQCENEEVAFFFKQWGGWGVDGKKRNKKENGRILFGKTWDELPLF